MRMRVLWLAVAAALLQGGALAAQGAPAEKSAPGQKAEAAPAAATTAGVSAITQIEVEAVLPALKVETNGGASAARAEWAKPGLGRGTFSYDAVKNALLIARLDLRDAGRLAGLDAATMAVRKANRGVYEKNWDRLDALLDNVVPGAGCSICRAAPRK